MCDKCCFEVQKMMLNNEYISVMETLIIEEDQFQLLKKLHENLIESVEVTVPVESCPNDDLAVPVEFETLEFPRYIQLQTCYPVSSVLSEEKRTILFSWLMQVILTLELYPETWLKTVAIFDQFSKVFAITSDKDIQNYGLASCYIAIKVEERIMMKAEEFSEMSDNGFTKTDLLSFEWNILGTLNFRLPSVDSITILHLLTKLTNKENRRMGSLNNPYSFI